MSNRENPLTMPAHVVAMLTAHVQSDAFAARFPDPSDVPEGYGWMTDEMMDEMDAHYA